MIPTSLLPLLLMMMNNDNNYITFTIFPTAKTAIILLTIMTTSLKQQGTTPTNEQQDAQIPRRTQIMIKQVTISLRSGFRWLSGASPTMSSTLAIFYIMQI